MKGCRPLEQSEVTALLAELPARDRLLLLTGLSFGTRVSETLSFTFGDVAGRYVHIASAKGSDNISFEIPPAYRTAVNELRAEYESAGHTITNETPLFLSRKGVNRAISRQQASEILTTTARALGIEGKVNTHSLRKSFVTKIYNLTGRDIAQTKKYSRHKNLANLDYYIGTTEDLSLVAKLDWT
jgi:integrase